jgi:hypothetical protein
LGGTDTAVIEVLFSLGRSATRLGCADLQPLFREIEAPILHGLIAACDAWGYLVFLPEMFLYCSCFILKPRQY